MLLLERRGVGDGELVSQLDQFLWFDEERLPARARVMDDAGKVGLFLVVVTRHQEGIGGHGDLPPGRGVVGFGPYLREIKALGIDGALSIELEYSPQPDQIAAWVREAYEATDRLMREAGLRG